MAAAAWSVVVVVGVLPSMCVCVCVFLGKAKKNRPPHARENVFKKKQKHERAVCCASHIARGAEGT